MQSISWPQPQMVNNYHQHEFQKVQIKVNLMKNSKIAERVRNLTEGQLNTQEIAIFPIQYS